jgi:hypothetical protein
MHRACLPVLLVAAISATGCGTLCNFAAGIEHPDSEPSIYGGVRRDIDFATEVVSSRPEGDAGPDKNAVVLALACVGLAGAEAAASFCADTATLPITVALQNKRADARKREAKQAEASFPRPNLTPGDEKSVDHPANDSKPGKSPEP